MMLLATPAQEATVTPMHTVQRNFAPFLRTTNHFLQMPTASLVVLSALVGHLCSGSYNCLQSF